MRALTLTEIERLARRPEVRRTAAKNFLSTLDESLGYIGNRARAYQNARQYGWNMATRGAIMEGIRMAFR